MPEDSVNIVDGLRGQQEQLKRLLAQTTWISRASTGTLSEIRSQIRELKRLTAQLESDIGAQLRKRTRTQPMRQRSAKDSAKAHDLAEREIDKLSDKSTTPEKRQERKRQLLKRPGE